MLTPKARGALSAAVNEALCAGLADDRCDWPVAESGDDAALTLWTLYELHYRGFEDLADESLEWHPELLRLRRLLERDLERRLRERYSAYAPHRSADFADDLFAYVSSHDGASVAAHVHRHADREQVLDLLRVRSIYHLKEADPTAWVVPRLPVGPKAALVELQYDEYGVGDPNRLHAHLWALGMEAAGLRADYGAYLDEVPLEVLEQNNAMSLFGLHRRLRGAALGHLAAFEATSSMPSRRMAQGLERLGLPAEIVDYYTEHVEADAVHEQLAVRNICGRLVEVEPGVADDVFFGAFTCLDLEDRFARWMLAQWGVSEGQDPDEERDVAPGSAA
ncbi:iron-containing redox enzyme family protein [Nocardioides ferulae]|uniref:iron-containing redox enzyme family protein n=1 Tax=Nocardioides ferulae TaxID=2340821 RepID=UPI000EAE570A|nr:iron-containing redox enzyme family protein [Nocardioides ferulae]